MMLSLLFLSPLLPLALTATLERLESFSSSLPSDYSSGSFSFSADFSFDDYSANFPSSCFVQSSEATLRNDDTSSSHSYESSYFPSSFEDLGTLRHDDTSSASSFGESFADSSSYFPSSFEDLGTLRHDDTSSFEESSFSFSVSESYLSN